MGGGGAERDMVGLKRKGGVSRVWRGGGFGVWGLEFGVLGFGRAQVPKGPLNAIYRIPVRFLTCRTCDMFPRCNDLPPMVCQVHTFWDRLGKVGR